MDLLDDRHPAFPNHLSKIFSDIVAVVTSSFKSATDAELSMRRDPFKSPEFRKQYDKVTEPTRQRNRMLCSSTTRADHDHPNNRNIRLRS